MVDEVTVSEGHAASDGFEQFVAVEYECALGLALAMLGNVDDAVEVAQETMARSFEHWERVRDLDRPGAWARRVALNLIADTLRQRTRSRRLDRRLRSQPHPDAATAIASDSADWDAAFWAAVAALPRRQRDVTVLHYVHDLPIAEIAEIVEHPAGTVKSDLSRARATLRAQLKEREHG